jgi:hypothetical protein
MPAKPYHSRPPSLEKAPHRQSPFAAAPNSAAGHDDPCHRDKMTIATRVLKSKQLAIISSMDV